ATAVNLVALPEELVVTETAELAAALRELAMPLGSTFLNRHVEPRFSRLERDALAATSSPAIDPFAAAAATWSGRADRAAVHLARLRTDPGLPLVVLPQLAPA